MLERTPAFSGITGAVDLFQGISSCPPEEVVDETSLVLESPEQELVASLLSVGRRKRKRKRYETSIENLPTSAADLLPLQQQVLVKQMAVFQLSCLNKRAEGVLST